MGNKKLWKLFLLEEVSGKSMVGVIEIATNVFVASAIQKWYQRHYPVTHAYARNMQNADKK
jgi:hypothetical protein